MAAAARFIRQLSARTAEPPARVSLLQVHEDVAEGQLGIAQMPGPPHVQERLQALQNDGCVLLDCVKRELSLACVLLVVVVVVISRHARAFT